MLALTRAVPATIAECELTHLEREPIDWRRADEQHRDYERALQSLGCRVQRLPAADALSDSVFIEDTAVVVDECAVIARPGAESRRPETSAVAQALWAYRPVMEIRAPATLDGGDVVRLGRRVYVGLSRRTNADGARQLKEFLAPFGYSVNCVSVHGCLHLKTAVSALDDRILINPRWAEGAAFGATPCIEVDPAEPFAANVIHVNEAILCAGSVPRTRARLESYGYRVFSVDASELAKAEAGLTCCSILVNDAGH